MPNERGLKTRTYVDEKGNQNVMKKKNVKKKREKRKIGTFQEIEAFAG